MTDEDALARLDPQLLASIVAFLRDWLPVPAREIYRRMIAEDPDNWYRHPHFGGGIIEEHALRAHGINEKVLGVKSLAEVWPELLERAVRDP